MDSKANVPSKIIGAKLDVQYDERKAVRTIIENDKAEIILIKVSKGSHYKLPGGGIEADEDHHVAAQREALEETGCKIITRGMCAATVEEWRSTRNDQGIQRNLHQLSFCYFTKLVEDTGKPQLTDDEKSDGLEHEWLSIENALAKMQVSQPTSELGGFIKERDMFFLNVFTQV